MSRKSLRFPVKWETKAGSAQCSICDAPLATSGGVFVKYMAGFVATYCLNCVNVLHEAAQKAPPEAVASSKRRIAKLYLCDSSGSSSPSGSAPADPRKAP